MHHIARRPPTKRLSIVIEHNPARTEHKSQTHVHHDGPDEADVLGPGGDELGEAVAPEVLVDGDGDEDAAGDGLVAVDAVGAADRGDGGDLDADQRVADDDDCLFFARGLVKSGTPTDVGGERTYFPAPLLLVAEGDDEVPEEHDDGVWDQGDQPHLGLTDAAVFDGLLHGDPV